MMQSKQTPDTHHFPAAYGLPKQFSSAKDSIKQEPNSGTGRHTNCKHKDDGNPIKPSTWLHKQTDSLFRLPSAWCRLQSSATSAWSQCTTAHRQICAHAETNTLSTTDVTLNPCISAKSKAHEKSTSEGSCLSCARIPKILSGLSSADRCQPSELLAYDCQPENSPLLHIQSEDGCSSCGYQSK